VSLAGTGRSSNGRTRGSGPRYRGSNPCLPAKYFQLLTSTRLIDARRLCIFLCILRRPSVLEVFCSWGTMKRIVAPVLSLLIVLGSTALLSAKGLTTKVRIIGGNLTAPVEISDPEILKNFNVWAGPGTFVNGEEGTEGFMIDWASGAVVERPSGLDGYDVSFFVKYANRPAFEQEDQLAYVVRYEVGPDGQGYVYLPGKTDEPYRLNVRAIHRGREGHWFRATNAWQNAVGHLVVQVAR
jgi:hypothetical protein